MPSEIKPALTPEEWADGGFERRLEGAGVAINRLRTIQFLDCTQAHSEALILDKGGPSLSDPVIGILDESRHAIAALCLHGQPFGFTQEDVQHLRMLRRWWLDGMPMTTEWRIRLLATIGSVADRIEALLPPEGT